MGEILNVGAQETALKYCSKKGLKKFVRWFYLPAPDVYIFRHCVDVPDDKKHHSIVKRISQNSSSLAFHNAYCLISVDSFQYTRAEHATTRNICLLKELQSSESQTFLETLIVEDSDAECDHGRELILPLTRGHPHCSWLEYPARSLQMIERLRKKK